MYIVEPRNRTIALEAQFLAPVAHQDPSVNVSSNERPFLRRKTLIKRNQTAALDQAHVSALVAQYPCPATLSSVMQELGVGEYLAVALIRVWITEYNYGAGLFDGMERYRRLEDRMKMAAARAATIFEFVGILNDSMQVPAASRYEDFVPLLSAPAALGWAMIKAMIENSAAVIMLARAWNEARKEMTMRVEPTPLADDSSADIVLDVPSVSPNSIRHEILREPGAWHLLNALGLRLDDLPPAVAVLLYNGGDLKTTEPAGAFSLARQVRNNFPLLGLLGGSVDGFILGSSNVELNAWLVVRENQSALDRYGINAEISAFELIDRETMTRHAAGRVDASPMPYGFEALITGTRLLIEIRLRPYATELEMGALMAAIETYIGADSTLFGQSAKGFGLAQFGWIEGPDSLDVYRDAYNDYLAANRDRLKAGLLDGTLATDKVLLA